jgi:hypothetical protein
LSAQTPSSQIPSNILAEAPSSQAKTQTSTKAGRSSRRAHRPLPVKPPAEVTDPSDMRRVAVAI